jgi:heme ABC exporter ATP-binding subunit CcmA
VPVVAEFTDAVVTSNAFPLLSGLSLRIDGPSFTVLTGANGAGKTSLLRLLGGLVPLASGSAEVLGVDIATGDRRLLRRRVGWLGHEGAFYDDLSVSENLLFAASALGRPASEIEMALDRVGLRIRATTITKSLSAGQRRRMSLAWMMVRRPELWLLDEPYASLDSEGRELLSEIIANAISSGASVVVTSHDALKTTTPSTTVLLSGGRVTTGNN